MDKSNSNILVEQLRVTLSKMEVALGAVADAIVWTDETARVQWCNKSFTTLVKRSRLEVLGKDLSQLIYLEGKNQPGDLAHQLLDSPTCDRDLVEIYKYQQDDRQQILEISYSCFQVTADKRSIVMVIRDITEKQKHAAELQKHQDYLEQQVANRTAELTTANQLLQHEIEERKRIEASLRNSEARLRLLVSSIPIILFAFDLQGIFTLSEGKGLSLLGLQAGQMVGKSAFEVYKDRPDIVAKIRRALAGETFTVNLAMADFTFECYFSYILDRQGKIIGAIGLANDITDRKQAEEELRLQNWRSVLFAAISSRIRQSLDIPEILNTTVHEVRNFLQADRVLIYQFDLNWDGSVVVESVSSQWTSSLGVIIKDTCFHEGCWQDYQHGKKMAIDDVEAIQLSPCHKNLLDRFQVKANLVVPILESDLLWGLLIVHQCSAPRHWRSFEIDFLSQFANQVGIALYQARLLEQETQRRQQLAQQNIELEQARRESETATKMKSAFLATMSHEIRTPMNAVLGMTGLLMDTDLNYEQQDFAETIRVSGENLLTLINEILDFSKLEAGEMELEILDFNLATYIEEITDLFANTAQSKGLELASLIYKDVPLLVKGDIGRLRQVIVNLVSNAIKFTASGEVVIRASLQAETTDTATIEFSVTDSGIGISPDVQQKLFQPFTQVDASTTRKYGGTGLGLAICLQIVELMGGSIGIESKEGQGSKFWFTVMLGKQLIEAPSVSDDETIIEVRLEGRKVLVVDDSNTNCKILIYQLSSWQMQVDAVNHASEALAHLYKAVELRRPYDIAILDMQMPDVDGEMLGEQIKTDDKLRHTKLVMMSSLNNRRSFKRMQELGFSAYLMKPVKQSRLMDCLKEVLSSKGEHLVTDRQRQTPLRPLHLPKSASKLKILLAEDSLINQKVAINQLKNLGYEVDVAANGKEVLEAIARIRYDLILMDCQMPELDGYTTTRRIRQLDNPNCDIAIVAMTANALKEDRARCLNAGMDDYVSKPIRKEDLAAKLKYWERIILVGDDVNIAEDLKNVSDIPPTISQTISTPVELPVDIGIDWKYLNQVTGENEEFKNELLKAFVETMPPHLELLKQAIATANYSEIEQKAHLIKGSSASMGIRSAELPASQLEQQGRWQQLDNAEQLFSDLEAALCKIQAIVQADGNSV